MALLAAGPEVRTPLQRDVLRFHRILRDVRTLSDKEQATWASITQRATLTTLGRAIVLDEAEEIKRQQAA